MYGRDVGSNEKRNEDRAYNFIQRIQQVHQAVREQLDKIQAQYKSRHEKHMVDHQLQFGDQVWLHISKEILKGEENKIKPIRYGTFTILEKSGTNSFHIYLPPYMNIYSVVNVERLKLF
jgi:GTP-binding protein EngB required for normal cell division